MMNQRANLRRRGMAMIWVIFGSFFVVSASFVLWVIADSSHRMTMSEQKEIRGDRLAWAATEFAINELSVSLSRGTADLDEFEGVIEATGVTYTVQADGDWVDPDTEADEWGYTRVYRVEAVADVEGSESRVRRVVIVRNTPLFQFAFFFNQPMVWFHPAPMEVVGRVHCNSDIYIETAWPLTFNTNYLKAAGSLYMDRPYSGFAPGYNWGKAKPVDVRKWVADPFDGSSPEEYVKLLPKKYLDDYGAPSTSGTDSRFGGYDAEGDGLYTGPDDWLPFGPWAMENFGPPDYYPGTGSDGVTLETAEHGTGEIIVPGVESLEMYVASDGGSYAFNATTDSYQFVGEGLGTHEEGTYHEVAGLSILTYEDGSWAAFDEKDLDITDKLQDAVVMSTLYDARQAEGSSDYTQVLEIDVKKLGDSGRFPDNGLLYLGAYGAGTGAMAHGFMLHNGTDVPGDLTVTSPNSVYVQGDFNTFQKKSVAIMADSVNALSNSWDGSKSPSASSPPSASETTYNMSVVTGFVDETTSSWSGGPNNLVRFHESWSGKKFNFNGSMATLFEPRYATGTFKVYGNYYTAPNRQINYDEDLSDIMKIPPFTPRSIEIEDVVQW